MMRKNTPLRFLGQKKMKSDTRQCFLIIEGNGWSIAEKVPVREESEARNFAAKVNAAANAARNGVINEGTTLPHSPPATAASSIGVAEELRQLAELKVSGILTEEEFEAQKARLLGNT